MDCVRALWILRGSCSLTSDEERMAGLLIVDQAVSSIFCNIVAAKIVVVPPPACLMPFATYIVNNYSEKVYIMPRTVTPRMSLFCSDIGESQVTTMTGLIRKVVGMERCLSKFVLSLAFGVGINNGMSPGPLFWSLCHVPGILLKVDNLRLTVDVCIGSAYTQRYAHKTCHIAIPILPGLYEMSYIQEVICDAVLNGKELSELMIPKINNLLNDLPVLNRRKLDSTV